MSGVICHVTHGRINPMPAHIDETQHYDADPTTVFAMLRNEEFIVYKCQQSASLEATADVTDEGDTVLIHNRRVLPANHPAIARTLAAMGEMKLAQSTYGPLYDRFAKMDLKEVAGDAQARAMGERLYLNTCAQCHGADARGAKGFPNLADADWLYGGAPDAIKTTIAQGRMGVMPPQAAAVGSEQDVRNVAEYVLSLSGSPHDPLKAQLGQEKFATICAACHGPEGKGNPLIGAPNLTDKIWLHGSGVEAVVNAINKGFSNQMPAHGEFLGDAKVHVLAAYVWGLSNGVEPGTKK